METPVVFDKHRSEAHGNAIYFTFRRPPDDTRLFLFRNLQHRSAHSKVQLEFQ